MGGAEEPKSGLVGIENGEVALFEPSRIDAILPDRPDHPAQGIVAERFPIVGVSRNGGEDGGDEGLEGRRQGVVAEAVDLEREEEAGGIELPAKFRRDFESSLAVKVGQICECRPHRVSGDGGGASLDEPPTGGARLLLEKGSAKCFDESTRVIGELREGAVWLEAQICAFVENPISRIRVVAPDRSSQVAFERLCRWEPPECGGEVRFPSCAGSVVAADLSDQLQAIDLEPQSLHDNAERGRRSPNLPTDGDQSNGFAEGVPSSSFHQQNVATQTGGVIDHSTERVRSIERIIGREFGLLPVFESEHAIHRFERFVRLREELECPIP